MPKFRKKPVVIEAVQWFKNGDHPQDHPGDHPREWEGKVVRYFRRPEREFAGTELCPVCNSTYHTHGFIDTLEGGHRVCPGDWIIKGVAGEFYPCRADIFEKTYEPVAD